MIVTQEVFEAYIATYPRQLTRQFVMWDESAGYFDPTIKTENRMVASESLANPGRRYWINPAVQMGIDVSVEIL